MGALIARKFEKEGDVELVCGLYLLYGPLTDRGTSRLETSFDDRPG